MSDRYLALRTRKVLDALDAEFATAGVIALRAGLPTRERAALAEQACGALVRLGLAQQGGTPERPRWRRLNPEKA